jgi:hypothetical protein
VREEVSFSHTFHVRVCIGKKIRVTSSLQVIFTQCTSPDERPHEVTTSRTFALPRDMVRALNTTWKTAKKNTKICNWCSPSDETSDTFPCPVCQ